MTYNRIPLLSSETILPQGLEGKRVHGGVVVELGLGVNLKKCL
jgi:hypothetical protein